jgi:hypothetical protein
MALVASLSDCIDAATRIVAFASLTEPKP